MNNIQAYRKHFTNYLHTHCLPQFSILPTPLRLACIYTLTPPGQLIRPALVYAICEDFKQTDHAPPCALAIELLHSYSLIHDDLPCMDNDDFRRNKPSLHKQFDETTALLVGDALHSLAFSHISLSLPQTHSALITQSLSQHAGLFGMILGQYQDLYQRINDYDELLQMYDLKTGGLFQAALSIGPLLAHQAVPDDLSRLAQDFGRFFQIHNDLKAPPKNPAPHHIQYHCPDHILSEKWAHTQATLAHSLQACKHYPTLFTLLSDLVTGLVAQTASFEV